MKNVMGVEFGERELAGWDAFSKDWLAHALKIVPGANGEQVWASLCAVLWLDREIGVVSDVQIIRAEVKDMEKADAITEPRRSFVQGHNAALRSVLEIIDGGLGDNPVPVLRPGLREAVEEMARMLEDGEWAEHVALFRAPGDKVAARLEAAITDALNPKAVEATVQEFARTGNAAEFVATVKQLDAAALLQSLEGFKRHIDAAGGLGQPAGGEKAAYSLGYNEALRDVAVLVSGSEEPAKAPAMTDQQVFNRFSFLEGLVGQNTYRQIAETAIEIRDAAPTINAEMLNALKLLTEPGTKQSTGLGWNQRVRMAREVIAKAQAAA